MHGVIRSRTDPREVSGQLGKGVGVVELLAVPSLLVRHRDLATRDLWSVYTCNLHNMYQCLGMLDVELLVRHRDLETRDLWSVYTCKAHNIYQYPHLSMTSHH